MSKLIIRENEIIRDGKPFRMISGTIHYFRVVEEYWEDRLKKLKECGMNTVETYTCWNAHERKEGCFDFSGRLNIAHFLEIAKQLGLYVILRPGPYICGEWDKGGLPSWLEMVPGIELRCMNKPFLEKTANYFKRLFDEVRPYLAENGGNIIAVQIENEYGSYGDDHEYMAAIKQMIIDNGVNEMLFTSDGPGYFMLNGGSLPDTVATINFGSNPKDNFKLLRDFRPNAPIMCTEYWNGWFDHWYEEHHTRDAADTADVMKEMLAMGASVNMYMFHGGTNFGFMNGANFDKFLQPTITSYDYNCPLSESGDITQKYMEVRKAIAEITGEKTELTVNNLKKAAYGRVDFTEKASLLDNISELSVGETVKSREPKSFEEIGTDFGYVLYRSVLNGPFEKLPISIDGLNDRAEIMINGKIAGIKENTGKRDDDVLFGLGKGESANIDILVENLGRVNYGGHIRDLKGITGGVRFANCYHFGWEMYALPLDDVSKIVWKEIASEQDEEQLHNEKTVAGDAEKTNSPLFFKGFFDVKEKADTFIKLMGLHKGCVFINGFNIGRFWNDAGPQKTLYVPAPLLKKGKNEVIVFESDMADEECYALLTEKEELG